MPPPPPRETVTRFRDIQAHPRARVWRRCGRRAPAAGAGGSRGRPTRSSLDPGDLRPQPPDRVGQDRELERHPDVPAARQRWATLSTPSRSTGGRSARPVRPNDAVVCISVRRPLANGRHRRTGAELAPTPWRHRRVLQVSGPIRSGRGRRPGPCSFAYTDTGVRGGDGVTTVPNINLTGTAGSQRHRPDLQQRCDGRRRSENRCDGPLVGDHTSRSPPAPTRSPPSHSTAPGTGACPRRRRGSRSPPAGKVGARLSGALSPSPQRCPSGGWFSSQASPPNGKEMHGDHRATAQGGRLPGRDRPSSWRSPRCGQLSRSPRARAHIGARPQPRLLRPTTALPQQIATPGDPRGDCPDEDGGAATPSTPQKTTPSSTTDGSTNPSL